MDDAKTGKNKKRRISADSFGFPAAVAAFLLAAILPLAAAAAAGEVKRGKSNGFQSWEYRDGKIAQFVKENETAGDADVVFLGDSLTDLCDLKTYYPTFNALNRGISGDTTTGVLLRLKESVFDVKPKVVVMMIGINNFNSMMEDYEQILKAFQKKAPETKIVLLSLTPTGGAPEHERLTARNEEIRALADKYGYTYVDVYSPMYDENAGKPKEGCLVDGLHYTDAGYKVISAAVTPVLEKLLGRENRACTHSCEGTAILIC